MSTSCAPRLRLGRCGWAAVVVGALMFLVTVAGPALAHSDLVSSDPEDGSTLTRPPREVVLTFNEEIQDTGTAVVVTGPDGERIDDPETVQVGGPEVSVSVATEVPEGGYEVAYRVVSADGHVISGTLGYRLDLGEAATPTTTPGAAATGPGPATTPAAQPVAGTDDGASSAPLWGVLIGVLVVAAVALTLVLRRARHARD